MRIKPVEPFFAASKKSSVSLLLRSRLRLTLESLGNFSMRQHVHSLGTHYRQTWLAEWMHTDINPPFVILCCAVWTRFLFFFFKKKVKVCKTLRGRPGWFQKPQTGFVQSSAELNFYMGQTKALKVCAWVGPAPEQHLSDAKHVKSNKKNTPAVLCSILKGSRRLNLLSKSNFLDKHVPFTRCSCFSCEYKLCVGFKISFFFYILPQEGILVFF